PAKISTREKIEWVVIEEPEMGLHPQAIQTVMLLCLELLSRGYRVVITTHSPVFLELAWAIRCIQPKGQADALFRLFGLTRKDSALKEVFQTCLMEKTFKTYFFRRNEEGIHIQDISELDPGSDDPAMAHWGGLSEFASRAGEVVAQMAQQ
ncbi:MAG: ATP-binding protein, partial [Saprospiraceae bacterium]|nr:ATP-binding protein [Saprospiraceae bacterium]